MAATTKLVVGATTYTLSGDGATILGCRYFPSTPGEGDERLVETCTLTLDGTAAAVRGTVQALGRGLLEARRRAESGYGADVFVRYTAASGEEEYRSRVYGGRLVWPEEADRRRLGGPVEVGLIWERDPFWEDVDLVELALTNGNGSAVTGGLGIYNHDDGGAGHDNYVEIDAAYALGDLPGALKIELTNTIGAGQDYGNVYVGHNWGDEPFDRILEAEHGSGGSSTGSAAASGGYYHTLTVPTSYSGAIWSYLLSNLELDAFAGRPAALLARFQASPTSGITMYWRLTNSSVEVYRSPEIVLGLSQVQLTGVLRLPPALRLMEDLSSLQLDLFARHGSGTTLQLDFVQLTPTDGFRRLYTLAGSPSVTFSNGGVLGMDDSEGEDRIYWYGSGKYFSLWSAEGPPVRLEPGKTQRLYFLHDEQSYASNIADTWDVQVWTRARRSTI